MCYFHVLCGGDSSGMTQHVPPPQTACPGVGPSRNCSLTSARPLWTALAWLRWSELCQQTMSPCIAVCAGWYTNPAHPGRSKESSPSRGEILSLTATGCACRETTDIDSLAPLHQVLVFTTPPGISVFHQVWNVILPSVFGVTRARDKIWRQLEHFPTSG